MCPERYSPRATTPKTNRAPNELARPVCAQESIFWAKFGLFGAKNPYLYGRKQKFWYPLNGKTALVPCSHRFWVGHGIKWAKNANIWPKMIINAIGPNFVRFCARIPNFNRRKQKFWYPLNGKPPRHLVCFWSAMSSNWPKMPIFGHKCQFWAKFGSFWAKILIFKEGSKSFGTHQGCINCAILLSGIGARGVSSEHMKNMEMFSCSPT